MAEFVESLSSFKPAISFIEIEQSLDSMSHLGELNNNVMDKYNHSANLMGFSNDNFLPFLENFTGFSPVECLKPAVNIVAPTALDNELLGGDYKKRKADAVSRANSGSSSVSPSEAKRKNSSRGVKRGGRSSPAKADQEKPMEVVHVRARRGQATDSHSLAERVRREKINERMRYLQDLVPGCYKTMGMAGMLDEIINYVQSLQNQVEFLSMKLTAASSFYDFNLDVEATTPQVLPRVEAYQAQEMDRLMMREGYEDLQPTIFPF